MSANLLFSSKAKGDAPAKTAKLYFIKDLLAATEGDC